MKTVKFQEPGPHKSKLSPEAQAKRRKFKQKFGSIKDKLTKDEVRQIVASTNAHFGEKDIDVTEISNKIFEDLDKKKTGYIDIGDLMEQIILNSEKEEFNDFRDQINLALHTKSEDIIVKLKRLQGKKWMAESQKCLENVEFIIKSITEENLYEIDSTEFSNRIQEKKHDGIGFLVKYSQIEDSAQKDKDFRMIRSTSKVYSSTNLRDKININKTSSRFGKRRSTNLTTMISPSIIARIHNEICKIEQCDFNIFELDELMGKKATIYIAHEILGRFEIVENGTIEPEIFKNFVEEIVDHYDRVHAIYHNDLHAGDVMQTVFTIFMRGDIQNKLKLGQLDTFALLVGALCHDFRHPGQNNLYHINTKSKIAMRYNDISVLEMYHVAQSFKVISKAPFNIFKNFTPEEYRICRRRMIDGIIATDMANHQKVIAAAKTKAEFYDISKGKNFEKIVSGEENSKNLAKLFDSQQCILNMILHTADISNPGKPTNVSAMWTKRVYDEFFIQGDMEKERGLPISNFCDRSTTNVNKAMVGFITFVVGPTIDLLCNLIPEVSDYSDYCKTNLRKHQIGAKNDDRKALEQKNK